MLKETAKIILLLLVNRCLKVEGRRDGKIFMTVLDTPYEHD